MFPNPASLKVDWHMCWKSCERCGIPWDFSVKRGLVCISFSFINSYQLMEILHAFIYSPILQEQRHIIHIILHLHFFTLDHMFGIVFECPFFIYSFKKISCKAFWVLI